MLSRPLRSRLRGLAGVLGVATAGAMAAFAPGAHAQDLPPQTPGVTLQTYFLGAPPSALCTIKSGTTPNVDKLMPTIDFRTADEFGREDNLLSHVTANLNVPAAGQYVFRLTSDDGSKLLIDGQSVIDHDGLHGATSKDGAITLTPGFHTLKVEYFEASFDQVLKLEWQTPGSTTFTVVPNSVLSTERDVVRVSSPDEKFCEGAKDTPGDGLRLSAVNPNYKLTNLRPPGFNPMVGGLSWTEDGKLVVVTTGSVSPAGWVDNRQPGEVFILDNVTGETSPDKVTYKKVATDLFNPTGVDVVDGKIYVSERDKLTELTPDTSGDGFMEHKTIATWPHGGNFHEFAFGLLHDADYFYVSRSVAINNGGATTNPQPGQTAGTSIKIDRRTGEVSHVAGGLRTPNGMGWGPDNGLFVMDNQGAWLPASKLVHVKQDRFFNHFTNPAGPFDDKPVTQPVVWVPQNEIGNSPSAPVMLKEGPFAGQMVFGDVTYGGLQRAFLEKVDGEFQGAVFRHTAGLEAGVNRTVLGPDGALYVGGIGEAGNWSEAGKLRYGLQKLSPSGGNVFDMKSMSVVDGGFKIEYTQPLSDATVAGLADSYQVRQWRYVPTPSYGGPKVDEEVLSVAAATVSDDRRTVTLKLDGLKPGRVVHVRSPRPFSAQNGEALWNTEAWYTLNSLPGYVPPADRGYYEAEDAQLGSGAGVATEHSGYSGAGFVAGFHNQGATLTFTANVLAAGSYPVHIRYANGPNPFAGTKKVSLYVNGTEVDPLSLPSTVDWKTWRFLTRQLDLKAGANTISIRYEAGDDGNVNFDVLKVGEGADICAPATPEAGYTGLFDGTLESLTKWRHAGAGSFGRQADCSLRTEGGLGLLWYSEKQFESYSLKLDWKLVKDDNGGVFVGFPNPGSDPFVAVNRGYEVQIDATDQPDRTTGAIYTFQGANRDAVAAALKRVGQWNAYEIQVDGKNIKVFLNGTLVNDFTSTDPARDISRGFVGIQNHGGGEAVSYRNIRIKNEESGLGAYEAENATLGGGANTSTEHPGFTGSGYVQGFGNQGASVTFTATMREAGVYPVRIRYANGPNPFDGTKKVSLYVNGVKEALLLPRTGTWRTWGSVARRLALKAGANTIAIRYDAGDDGNVNFDSLTISDPDTYEAEDAALAGGANTSTEHPGYTGGGYVQGFQNLGASVTFSTNVAKDGAYPVTVRYANGPHPFDGTKKVSLHVNGEEIDPLALPSTGAWNAWGRFTRKLSLKAGANTIMIRYESGDDGNVNLDALAIGDWIDPSRYEAEEATRSGGAGVNTDHPGYTGDGFVDKFEQVGAAVTFAVNAGELGLYPVQLRYANGPNPAPGTKRVSLYVNETDLGQWALPDTGTWSTWASVTRQLKLRPGVNTVTIRYEDGDEGHVNLDHLKVGDVLPDTTAPETTASVAPAPVNGWHATPPTVTLAAEDAIAVASTSYRVDGGGWATYDKPFVVAGEGAHTVVFRSADRAGNVEADKTVEFSVDTVAPSVGFTGARTYTVDETVAIQCSATDPDPGSGVASTTCSDVSKPAWSYALGSHTVRAEATDKAGHTGSASATFEVKVTFVSLQALVTRFSDDPAVASGLNDKLIAAAKAKDAKTRRNLLDAFEVQLNKTAKAFTAEKVAVLQRLARALR